MIKIDRRLIDDILKSMPANTSRKSKSGMQLLVDFVVLHEEKAALRTAIESKIQQRKPVAAEKRKIASLDRKLSENRSIVAKRFEAIKQRYGYSL
jgi:hypothetical protein